MSIGDSENKRILKTNINIIKFITSLLCYIIIFIGGVLIINFANKRGNPNLLLILYYLSVIINLFQIAIVIIRFIVQQKGFFIPKIYLIENITAIIWETVIVAQFVCACVLFEAFRLDYLFISLAQGLAIILMLLYSKRIDYNINNRFYKKAQKINTETKDNRFLQKRENAKIFLYLFVLASVVFVEVGVLILPKIPPKIDDIFSENRVLEYKYYENKNGYDDGYYVSNIYLGTNDKVIIPNTYNDIPVVGILEDAISDIGKINSFCIGEYDDKGNLISNIKLIEKNGIKLNNIEEITIPSSVTSIKDNAITGNKIKTINYFSSSPFSSKKFNTQSLKKINILNENSVVDADYENISANVTIPNQLYNSYREKYFNSRELFDINEKDNFIVIDFETNSDYFLESKILEKNNSSLNITALKNNDEETSSLINDTAIYNKNNFSCDGYKTKKGFAFRGWYRDIKYTEGMECKFNDISLVTFLDDTTVYAKWNEIKQVKLDWSNYYPYNEKFTTINYIDTDDINESINFPKLSLFGGDVKRDGFSNLNWKIGDETVENTLDLYNRPGKIIDVKAEWILENPKLNYITKIDNLEYKGSNLTFTFDENQNIYYTTDFKHPSEEVALTVNWSKKNNNDNTYNLIESTTTTNDDSFNYLLHNVLDSGTYKFEIIAETQTGEKSSISHNYTINIQKKDLDISKFEEIPSDIREYNGNEQLLNYPDSLLNNIKITKYYDLGNGYSLNGPINASEKEYNVKVVFEQLGKEKNNYNLAYMYSSIKILPKKVTAIWEQQTAAWDNFKIEYDGNPHNYIPKVNGICGADHVEFLIAELPEINVGEYETNIKGVSNNNYILDDYIEKSHVWSISPRVINVAWERTTQTYNGSMLECYLNINGIVDKDKNQISKNDFEFITSCDVSYDKDNNKLAFGCTNAGYFNIQVLRCNNKNYKLKTSQSTNFLIEPVQLNTNFDKKELIYNGNEQYCTLTISGFVNKNDADKAYEKIQFDVNTNISKGELPDKVQGECLSIKLGAVDHGNYNISINGINDKNYKLSAVKESFTIEKKKLELKQQKEELIYNGQYQNNVINILGIVNKDNHLFDSNPLIITNNDVVVTYENNENNILLNAVNVNKYEISILGLMSKFDNSNYSIEPSSLKTYNFDIKPATINLNWSNNNLTYNGNNQSVIATIDPNLIFTNILTNQKDKININYNNNTFKDVNEDESTYKAKAFIDNTNYVIGNSTIEWRWKINKKPVYVTASKSGFTYDGKYKYFKVKYSGFEKGEDLNNIIPDNFTYTYNKNDMISFDKSVIENDDYVAYFKAIDVNNYRVTLSSYNLKNYEIKTMYNDFSIIQCKIDFDWNYDGNYVYRGKDNPYNVQPIFKNLKIREDTGEQDTTRFYVENDTKSNAGEYISTLKTISNKNYFIDELNNSLNWKIEQKELKLTWNNPDFYYNGYSQHKEVSSDEFSGDLLSFNYVITNVNDVNTEIYASIDKGIYRIKVQNHVGIGSENYKLPSNGLISEYEIKPKTINVLTRKYNCTYNGENQCGISVEFKDLVNRSDAEAFKESDFSYTSNTVKCNKIETYYNSCTFGFYGKNVGVYSLNVINSNNPNYVFISRSNQFEIMPRLIQVGWGNSRYTYDGKFKDFTPSIVNKVYGDTINVEYDFWGTSCFGEKIQSLKMKDSGKYVVSIKSIDNKNYTTEGLSNDVAMGQLSKEIIIDKRPINIDYNSYDLQHVYNGKYQGVTLKISGYINSDVLLFNSNPFVYTHSGVGKMDTYIQDDLVGNLKVYAVNNGDYNIEVKDLNENFQSSNYFLNKPININYQIEKAKISISWSSDSHVYNGQNKGIRATIVSDIYDNALTGKRDNPIFSYANDASFKNTAVECGTYTGKIEGISDSNYKLPSNITKSWSIYKKALNLNWVVAKDLVYDEKYKNASLVVNGFEQNDINFVTSDTFISTSDSMKISGIRKENSSIILDFKEIDANQYYYRLNSINNNNYKINNTMVGELKIAPKTLNLNWVADSGLVYDGKYKNAKLVVNGFEQNDINFVTSDTFISTSNSMKISGVRKENSSIILDFKEIDANQYCYKLNGINNNNYKINDTLIGEFTIAPKTLNLNWVANSGLVYDGKYKNAKLVVNGFEEKDIDFVTSNYFISTSDSMKIRGTRKDGGSIILDFKEIDANQYCYKLNGINNNNYKINDTLIGEFTIAPKILKLNWIADSGLVYDGKYKNAKLVVNGFEQNDIDFVTSNYFISTSDSMKISGIKKDGVSIIIDFKEIDANQYCYKLNGINNNNYKINDTLIGELKIAPKTLNLVWGQNIFSYDGSPKMLSCEHEGTCVREDTGVNDIITINLSNNINTNVGEFYSKVVGLEGKYKNNYLLSDNINKRWKITPVLLKAEWVDYDNIGENKFIYDGRSHKISCKISGFINDEASLFENIDFDSSYDSFNTTVSADVLYLDFQVKDVNKYSYEISLNKNKHHNYILTEILKYNVSISPSPLTITWDPVSDFEYNGKLNTISAYINGFKCSEETMLNINELEIMRENVSSLTLNKITGGVNLNFGIKDAESYHIGINKYNNNNYSLTSSFKDININKKELKATWLPTTSFAYNGSLRGQVLELKGFIEEEIPTLAVESSFIFNGNTTNTVYHYTSCIKITCYGLNVGSYKCRISPTYKLSNYNLVETESSFDITPKLLKTYWTTSSSNNKDVYDGTGKNVILNIEGICSSDTINKYNIYTNKSIKSVIKGKDNVIMVEYDNIIDSGIYHYSVTGIDLSNYELQSTAFDYVIEKAQLEIIYSGSNDIIYDGMEHERIITIKGFTEKDLNNISDDKLSYELTQGARLFISKDLDSYIIKYKAKNANVYTLNIDCFLNNNYSKIIINDSIKISQRELSIDENSIKDGNLIFSNLVEGESITKINYTVKVFLDAQHENQVSEWTNEGKYYYEIQLLNCNNYTLKNAYGEFNVTGKV